VANENLDSKPELGYWDARGAGAPIRYVLHYSGVEFVDTMYGEVSEKVKKTAEEYFASKAELG